MAVGVGIRDGTAEVIDATGCWVTPGFVDLHTHYDAELELDPALGESVRHGVTTVLIGSCGLSFAVGDPEDLADMFCRVEGVPRDRGAAAAPAHPGLGLAEGLLRPPRTPAARPERRVVPRALRDPRPRHGPRPGASTTASHADPVELERMAAMLDEALDAGYLGLSINTLPWDKMDGDRFRSRPTPSVFADVEGVPLPRRGAAPPRRGLPGVPDVSGRWNLRAVRGDRLGHPPQAAAHLDHLDDGHQGGPGHRTGSSALPPRSPADSSRADVRMQSLPQPFRLWTDGMENPVIEEFGAGTEALHLVADRRGDLLRDPAYRERFRQQWTNRLKGGRTTATSPRPASSAAPTRRSSGQTFAEVAAERGIRPDRHVPRPPGRVRQRPALDNDGRQHRRGRGRLDRVATPRRRSASPTPAPTSATWRSTTSRSTCSGSSASGPTPGARS